MAATRECYDSTIIVQSTLAKWPSEFKGRASPLLGSRIIVFQSHPTIPAAIGQ